LRPQRGDIVLVHSRRGEAYQAVRRPALVVQSDTIDADAYDSVVVCLITGSSTRGGVCRIELAASSSTGLERPSEIMAEKIVAIPRAQVGEAIGRADAATLRRVERALLLLLELA
jgi:mRNA interferase MazF